MLKLSVVICTHNRGELLEKSILSLDNQKQINSSEYEIVVVDDGSDDDTRTRVENINASVLVRYFYKDWGGRSEARNLGIEQSKGRVVLFVDDDVIAPPNFLYAHLSQYEKNDKIVVRGPIVNVNRHEMIPNFEPNMSHYSKAFFCTCNASTLRETLIEAGGFDTNFKEYGFEDNEIGWRLRQAGCKMVFRMDAYIFHYKPDEGREASQTLKEMKKRAAEMGRSAAIYCKKHRHWMVQMAVGTHPAVYYYSRLLNNCFAAGYGEKLINSGFTKKHPNLHSFFSKRIFQYHYLKSLVSALKENGSNLQHNNKK